MLWTPRKFQTGWTRVSPSALPFLQRSLLLLALLAVPIEFARAACEDGAEKRSVPGRVRG